MINDFLIEKRKTEFLSLARLVDTKTTQSTQNINIHIHSFYSYNAFGWSPYKIALECRKAGLQAAGIIDFDVLDGMEEFYEACDLLEMRGSVGIETRTFNDLMPDYEIDSPGEPGVSYIAGTGFTRKPENNSPEGLFLSRLFENSKKRNLALIHRINEKIPEIAIDYIKDVIPLTPSGNATERHIVEAYISLSGKKHPKRFAKIWAGILGMGETEISKLSNEKAAFEELVRKRLAKKGGLGYVQPSADTFPKTQETFDWIGRCGAIPTESWLDGTSDGEKDPQKLLAMSYEMGARALNIIPDRNWNLKDPEEKAIKIKNLRTIVQTAVKMGLPLHIGTEMNKLGQPFYDDLNGPVLSEFKEDFVKGAFIISGHVILSRFTDSGYLTQDLENELGSIHEKNLFFEKIGRLPALNRSEVISLLDAGKAKASGIIMDSAENGKWKID